MARNSLLTSVVVCLTVLILPVCCGIRRHHDERKQLSGVDDPLGHNRLVINDSSLPFILSKLRAGGTANNDNPTLVETDVVVDPNNNNNNETNSVSAVNYGSFEILDETIVYSGWRTILQRKVQMRNGKVVDFDLVGVKTGEGAVLVFAWDSRTRTATMIREYMPASHRVMYGLAAGLIEDKHGHDTEMAARHELEEECHLKGGRWFLLTNEPVAMDKYSTTKMYCYLVIDPEPEENPKPLDEEEDIEIVTGVTIPEILQWLVNGEMNLVGSWGALLAIEKLRELGEYP
ncbi:hypothetical protein IV203_019486 [Nitzschia inconspicua]|uniref:Nudix hydrolase domain-containing protein n=1 Tax=Nitzschia inconspicua TaxID=303405 RepID=A0A9K3Q4Y9_9STRA|nr:hypothetical protein IV203_019486 [Nitzschia inconspicua]